MSAVLIVWWIPVGAGGTVVARTSGWWERYAALIERRRARPLVHAALEIRRDSECFIVEMAPVWSSRTRQRGVVVTGPVGAKWMGVLPAFRYEIRRWRDGEIPDRGHAVAAERRVVDDLVASRLWEDVVLVPPHTWGRRIAGDMWNSNSVVSWLLSRAGVDIEPPSDFSTPGWLAGSRAAATS